MIKNFIKKYKFTILWTLVILILVLLPSNSIKKPKIIIENLDKIVHFILFTILSFFVQLESKKEKYLSLSVLIFIITFAISTEILQFVFTTTRKFELLDIFADISGIPFGYIFVIINSKIIKKIII